MTNGVQPPARQGLPVWAWVGIGCGAVLILVLVVVMVGGFFVARKVQDVAADFEKDPAMATARMIVDAIPIDMAGMVREAVLSEHTLTFALLAAHLIVFWLSQDSNVTPPVCLCAFAAAAIAKSPPMATGLNAWKIAKGLYVMPLLFAYTPLVSGSLDQALLVFAFALPDDVEKPIVFAFDPSLQPVVFLGVTGPYGPAELRRIAADLAGSARGAAGQDQRQEQGQAKHAQSGHGPAPGSS